MSGRPDIIELPPDALDETAEQMQTGRNFSVVAASQLDARTKLANAGVQVGAVYQSLYGETISSALVARRMKFVGQPDAPNVSGGDGDYLVNVAYSDRKNKEAAIGGPAVYRMRDSLNGEPADTDRHGWPVANVVEEPIDPPITYPAPNEVLVVEWWMQESGGDTALIGNMRPYKGALNSQAWQGAEVRSMLCHGVNIVEEGEASWFKLRGEFERREPIDVSDINGKVYVRSAASGGGWTWDEQTTGSISGWMQLRANRGRREKVGVASGGEILYERIKDNEGEPVDDPVFLDIDGSRLLDNEATVILAFDMIDREADFNNLGI